MRVGVGRKPPEDRTRFETGADGEGHRCRRIRGHDHEQEARCKGDPPHPGEELDHGHSPGNRACREKRLEQVHPVCRVAEREQVGGDEAQNYERGVAGWMGCPEHPRDGLELGGVPAGLGEDAGSESRDDEPQRRQRRNPRSKSRGGEASIQARGGDAIPDCAGATEPGAGAAGRHRRFTRTGRLRQIVTSQASLPRRCPTG